MEPIPSTPSAGRSKPVLLATALLVFINLVAALVFVVGRSPGKTSHPPPATNHVMIGATNQARP